MFEQSEFLNVRDKKLFFLSKNLLAVHEPKGFKIALGALALRAILCRKVNFRQYENKLRN
ncbi:hypothetical protein [Megamonas hypermegale]|uniref:hypothetical protein n=1 Tax=Megamonas hypermegale TaxID=158847 RepID=UPI0026EA0E12|nr:hypothetical protein [Megamonas hypermegale]